MKPTIHALAILLLGLASAAPAAPEPTAAPEAPAAPEAITRAKQEVPEFEDCTLADIEAAKSRTYSDEIVLQAMDKSITLKREGAKSPIYTSIRFFVVKDGNYLTHGFVKTNTLKPDRLSPGIPKLADPVILAIFPPAERDGEPIVQRYFLRERC